MAPTSVEAISTQARLRLRRWQALLAPGHGRIRRSAMRRRVLLEAVDVGGADPRETRRAITATLRRAIRATLDAGDEGDAFTPVARAMARAMVAAEAGMSDAHAIRAWDAVLTVAELRPSALPPAEVAAAVRRAARHVEDTLLLRRLEPALAARASEPGGYLRRAGIADTAAAARALWTYVEPAFMWVAPSEDHAAMAGRAFDNLVRWDALVAEMARRVARGPGGDDAGQAAAARFLEPRIVAAWAWLPPEDLYRVGATCGRHAHIATLTGPAPAGEAVDRAPDRGIGADAQLEVAERWGRFFAGLGAALDDGGLTPQQVVFLWLSAGIGAGEAWRATGGALERVGSANYARNKVLEALGRRVAGVPDRLSTPGAPDPRSRALLGLLTMRDAPDPSVEAEAGVPTDARDRAPPLDDRALVSLLYLLNLGPEAATAKLPGDCPAADDDLLARALRLTAWARRRRAVVRDRIRRLAGADDAASGLSDTQVLFLLGGMVGGLPSEAARWLTEGRGEPAGVDAALDRWLGADGTAHEVIEALRGADRRALPSPDTLPRRPVERDARLRLHLRALRGETADGR